MQIKLKEINLCLRKGLKKELQIKKLFKSLFFSENSL
jgi:hypothetical protein